MAGTRVQCCISKLLLLLGNAMPMPARNLRPSSTSLAAPRQYFVGGSLTKIAIADVPLMHPVHRVFDLYSALHKQDVGQHMPRLETVVSQLSPELMSYAMVLLPVSVNDSLDFAILHQGLNSRSFKGFCAVAILFRKCHAGDVYRARSRNHNVPVAAV
jgi:hypothetical protein